MPYRIKLEVLHNPKGVQIVEVVADTKEETYKSLNITKRTIVKAGGLVGKAHRLRKIGQRKKKGK